MHYKKCEICGIRAGRTHGEKRIFMAKFPLDENWCKEWVKITGKEDLLYVPIEKLHQLKQICGKHFLSKDFKKKKTQLKKNAIPSVGLTAEPLAEGLFIGFPLHIAKTETSNATLGQTESSAIFIEHSYCASWTDTICVPSTSIAEILPVTERKTSSDPAEATTETFRSTFRTRNNYVSECFIHSSETEFVKTKLNLNET